MNVMREIISAKEARARGLSTYFTGKPCKRGHVSERSVQAWDCVECTIIRARQRYADNPKVAMAHGAKRRAHKLRATPSWDSELTDFVSKAAHDLASERELATGFPWHVDHMIPLRARRICGLHIWSNLQVIPAQMNLSKRNRVKLTRPGEWIKHLKQRGEAA